MKALSDKRIRLLRLLAEYQRNEEFPLVREIAARLQLAGRTSLSSMLASLEQEGYVSRHGGGPARRECIYRLTPKGQVVTSASPNRLLIPVLGSIPAGPLAEAVQQCDELIDPSDALRALSGDFFLKVKGNSMIGDGILPDDWVLLRPGIQINNGEIAGVQIKRSNGIYESTLKHVHYEPDCKLMRLRASNPAYDDLVVSAEDVEIAGVYRGLVRRPD
jgi:repressor LexA